MHQLRALIVRSAVILVASLTLNVSPAAAQLADVSVSFGPGAGGTIDLDAGHFLRYQTDFVGSDLDFILLQRRRFDDDFAIGMIRAGDYLGLPFYGGYGTVTDPVTKQRSSGFALALMAESSPRSKLYLNVYNKDWLLLDTAIVSVSPAPVLPVAAPANPFLADSVGPIGHLNSAQTDSTNAPGPMGQTETLSGPDFTYEFDGPAHFGIAISPVYPGTLGKRVIWTNGGDRISKVRASDYTTLAELQIAATLMDEAESESRIAALDAVSGEALALTALPLAVEELLGLSGVYYALDADNVLFVGGSESIIAYADADPTDPASPINLKDEWFRPAGIGGNFVGANLTFDGKLCLVTDEGWVVVVERDFSSFSAIELSGSEVAVAHNAAMIAAGFRPGAASWVRNSVAIDEDGGIYVASLEHMHKVIWNGTSLSIDPLDGAWTAPFLNGRGIGTGATPSLMGFGDEDRFVVITDGEDLMNVVLFWRDGIPAGWTQITGAPDLRIAGQLPADFDDPGATAVQTEQSVIVGGYGAVVVNNEPPNDPPVGFPALARTLLIGYAGNDPLYTPHGIQKMEWNPTTQTFEDAWVQPNVSSTNGVPVVSVRSDLLYTVGARNGGWTLEAINWTTGDSAFHWVTGSARYNTRYSGLFLDEQGRIVHTTTYGILRYER